ncbi:MAG: tryptophan-rich sensory protein [Clostridiales bacterium]|nr:tryptophan-rich sensory protein [Clostridiales bacterium]
MKSKTKAIIVSIAIPLAVGGLSALITSGGMDTFEKLNKPPLSPPGWLFPIVWTILFIMMGIASYLVYAADEKLAVRTRALIVYAVQLGVNFFWSIFFFSFKWYLFSFFWLLLLWALIIFTTIKFYRISKTAAYLMVPYLLWVTFAGYLNLSISLLN